MFAFEIEIAERELLNPLFSYPYKVVPLSEQAKLNFYEYLKPRGPLMPIIHQRITEVLTEKNLARYPFVGKREFYYNNTRQTESVRIEMVKQLAILNLTRSDVAGFSHKDSIITTIGGYASLVEGVDYRIEIGDKVTYPEPAELNYDGIKAL